MGREDTVTRVHLYAQVLKGMWYVFGAGKSHGRFRR
jgi:hypothetical protein